MPDATPGPPARQAGKVRGKSRLWHSVMGPRAEIVDLAAAWDVFYKNRIERTLVTGGSTGGLGTRGMSIMFAAGARERLLDSRFDIAFGLTTNGG